MKIKCRYCGAYINDTSDTCPNCGAKNEDVVRTAKSQPKTIKELEQWYKDRGLPPYDVTRFFIGQDYKKPRAFGIYKDEKTGNFVVYKNKDNGQRAVRYEGTDEAYAVNELYMRLKQEILEQKANNLKKGGTLQPKKTAKGFRAFWHRTDLVGVILKALFTMGAVVVAPILLVIIIGIIVIIVENEPKQGYYQYEGDTYYYSTMDYGSDYLNWYEYEDEEWSEPIDKDRMPKELRKNKKAKKYYIQDVWDNSLGCTDFQDTIYYADIQKGFWVDKGYYVYDDKYYYHLESNYDSGWYIYSDDSDWSKTSTSNIPDDLKHPSMAPDFYYTPTWDSSTQVTDFMDSQVYEEYQEEQARIEAQKEAERQSDNDSDYDWDSSDSWDSGSTDWGSDW